jgi:WXXGXW repeat (2 copies)
MRQLHLIFAFIILLMFTQCAPTSAQRFVVKVRPAAVVIARPVAPNRNHVWVTGDWVWNGRQQRYIWREGYWAKPRPRHVWVNGYWAEDRYGSYWVAGHWRR